MNRESERDVILGYALRKFDAIVSIVRCMDDESANTTLPVQGSNSPYALLFHCMGAMRRWSSTVNLGVTIPRDRDAEFVAHGSVVELCAEAARHRQAFVDDVRATDLDAAPVAPPSDWLEDPARARLIVDCRGVLLHVVEELAQHLGHLEITRDMLGFLDEGRPSVSAAPGVPPLPGEPGVTNRAKLGLPAAQDIPRPLVFSIEGERFIARPDVTQPGAWMVQWRTGPNEGYGYMVRSSDHVWLDAESLREGAREFLTNIDPATGYLED